MNHLVETLNQAAETWWPYVFRATWQSSLVAAIVLAAVRLGRRWPAQVRYGLLLIALVKFAMPPTLAMPMGLFTRLGPAVQCSAGSGEAETAMAASQAEAGRQAAGGSAIAAGRTTLSWPAWLLVVHVLGVVLVATWIVAQIVRVKRMARRAQRVTKGALYDRFVRLAARTGLRRRVRLLLSSRPTSPMAFGLLRPSVLVPVSILRDMPVHQVETVLAHELAHHRRRDLWVNWLQIVLATVWWFNPIVRLLNRAIRRTSEDRCDDLLLARRLTTGESYCQALLKAASRLGRARQLGGALGFAERLHPLGERMMRIMDSRIRRSSRPSLAWAGMLVVLAALVLPGLRSRAGDIGHGPPRTPLAQPLGQAQAAEKNEPVGAHRLDIASTAPPAGVDSGTATSRSAVAVTTIRPILPLDAGLNWPVANVSYRQDSWAALGGWLRPGGYRCDPPQVQPADPVASPAETANTTVAARPRESAGGDVGVRPADGIEAALVADTATAEDAVLLGLLAAGGSGGAADVEPVLGDIPLELAPVGGSPSMYQVGPLPLLPDAPPSVFNFKIHPQGLLPTDPWLGITGCNGICLAEPAVLRSYSDHADLFVPEPMTVWGLVVVGLLMASRRRRRAL